VHGLYVHTYMVMYGHIIYLLAGFGRKLVDNNFCASACSSYLGAIAA